MRFYEDEAKKILAKHGIDASKTELQGFEVTDILANPYRGEGTVTSRYIISGTLMVRVNGKWIETTASLALRR